MQLKFLHETGNFSLIKGHFAMPPLPFTEKNLAIERLDSAPARKQIWTLIRKSRNIYPNITILLFKLNSKGQNFEKKYIESKTSTVGFIIKKLLLRKSIYDIINFKTSI